MKDRVAAVLSGIAKTGRVANAYLFTGGDTEHKLKTALDFAKEINCTAQGKKPCGECLNCRKAGSSVHPDIITVSKDGASFKIDQIRELKDLTRFGPVEGRYKVIIMTGAESLTQEAANSFLKTLEEPAPGVVFILISDREEGMLPTISSRCQKIIFTEPEIREATPEIRSIFDSLANRPSDFVGNTDILYNVDDHESYLSDLFTLFALNRKSRSASVILRSLRDLKRNANKKLTIDWMCLNLWKTS